MSVFFRKYVDRIGVRASYLQEWRLLIIPFKTESRFPSKLLRDVFHPTILQNYNWI